ncbi:hypothetical protein ABNF65_23120 [Paenibacillus larvae]
MKLRNLKLIKSIKQKHNSKKPDNEIQQRKGIIQQSINQKEEMETKLKEAEEQKKLTEKKLEDKRKEFQKMIGFTVSSDQFVC